MESPQGASKGRGGSYRGEPGQRRGSGIQEEEAVKTAVLTGLGGNAGPEKPQQKEKSRQRNRSIQIGTLNIVDGRGNQLKLACRTMESQNVDIGILTKAKLGGIHTEFAYKYRINATRTRGTNQGGVALVPMPAAKPTPSSEATAGDAGGG